MSAQANRLLARHFSEAVPRQYAKKTIVMKKASFRFFLQTVRAFCDEKRHNRDHTSGESGTPLQLSYPRSLGQFSYFL